MHLYRYRPVRRQASRRNASSVLQLLVLLLKKAIELGVLVDVQAVVQDSQKTVDSTVS